MGETVVEVEGVTEGVNVSEAVAVPDMDGVSEVVCEAEVVPEGVCDGVSEPVGVGVTEGVNVSEAVGEGVPKGDLVGESVGDGEGVLVKDGVRVREGVPSAEKGEGGGGQRVPFGEVCERAEGRGAKNNGVHCAKAGRLLLLDSTRLLSSSSISR